MSNILGLGLDATDIDRIADTIERYGERFLRRIFTEGEVAYCARRKVPAIHFAGRFAAHVSRSLTSEYKLTPSDGRKAARPPTADRDSCPVAIAAIRT